MTYDYRREVGDIVEALAGAKARGRACSLLIGAGCSVEGGIPTASRFVELIRDRYPRAYNRARAKTYAACMAELSVAERHALIAEQVDAAHINWAHIGIALLMQHGFVDRILTTNFDPLIIRACALLGEFPAVYDFAASQEFKPDFVPDKAVFYLHGQRTGFRLMNTKDEVDALSRSLAPVFLDAGRGRTWIVAGYSGSNDPVFEQLTAVRQFDHQLFWVGYKDEEPSTPVLERLLVPGKYAFLISGHTADTFFVELAQQLGIFPPIFVARPFTHLAGQLRLLAEYTPPGGTSGMNVLNVAREWIAGAQRTYEAVEQNDENAQDRDVVGQILQYYMEGDYDRVIGLAEAHRDTFPPTADEVVAWAYLMLGIRAEGKALSSSSGREHLFDTAIEDYRKALQWKSNFPLAMYSWGITLGRRAEGANREDAERLLRNSEEKYAEALRLSPDMHDALNNWGATLIKRAEMTNGEAADVLLQEAAEKFAQAVVVQPDQHETLNNWGLALCKRADLASGPRAEALIREAEMRYSRAVEVKADFDEAWNNWGAALARRAGLSHGSKAEELLRQAEEKFAEAVTVKPDQVQALYNWGATLARRADLISGVDVEELRREAEEKFELAAAVNPDSSEVLSRWGLVLAKRAWLMHGSDAIRVFEQAEEKFSRAVSLEPNNHDALTNWGVSLTRRASLTEGEEAATLISEAEEKYIRAEQIRPGAGAYNIACLHAIQNDQEGARHWLTVSANRGTLPSLEYLRTDPDLNSLRDTVWFEEFIISRAQPQERPPPSGTALAEVQTP